MAAILKFGHSVYILVNRSTWSLQSKNVNKQTITMKTAAVFVLALVCVFGVALGQFGFGNQAATGGGIGGGGLLALLGLLLIFTLFTNSSSTGTGSTTIIYGNYSG